MEKGRKGENVGEGSTRGNILENSTLDSDNFCDGSIWTKTEKGWTNPVHLHKDGIWWFVDETWIEHYGPYKDIEEANAAIKRYCEECL